MRTLEESSQNIDLTKIHEIFHSNDEKIAFSHGDDQNLTSDSIVESEESFPGFSHEERKLLINKIIEKRKSNRQSKLLQQQYRELENDSTDSVSTIAGDDNDNANTINKANLGNNKIEIEKGDDVLVPETWEESDYIPNEHNNINLHHKNLLPPSSGTSNNDTNQNTTPAHVSASYSSSSAKSFQNHHKNNRNYSNNNSFESTAAMLNEYMKDCTFSPRIKKLPQHYGAATKTFENVPFYDRVTKWQKDKKAEILQKKIEVVNNDLTGCTFKPKINRNSEKAVEEIRKNTFIASSDSVHDRLYKGMIIIIVYLLTSTYLFIYIYILHNHIRIVYVS